MYLLTGWTVESKTEMQSCEEPLQEHECGNELLISRACRIVSKAQEIQRNQLVIIIESKLDGILGARKM